MLKEKEFSIIQGGGKGLAKFYFSEDRERIARSSFGYIMNDIEDLKDRYIKLGFHLDEFNRFEYYKSFGYWTFKEFCNENMPLAYSTIMKCIQVFYEFSEVQGTCHKMWIDEKYKDFSFTQLSEMLSLDSRQREIIKPDWSCEKIRRYKKGLKRNRSEVEPAVEEDAQERTDLDMILNRDDVMTYLIGLLQMHYGKDCLENVATTAKTATFSVAGNQYRLQLNKVKS